MAQGRFSITWRIENLTSGSQTLHWFAGGIHGATLDEPFEHFNVPIGSELIVTTQGTFDPGQSLAGVVLHATSVPGTPAAAAHYPFYFHDHPVSSSSEQGTGQSR